MFAIFLTSYYFLFVYNYNQLKEYRIDLMYSEKGEFASSEQPIIKAIQLAADKLNALGGFGGRKVKIVLEDLEVGNQVYKKLATKLIVDKKIDVIYGCWTSACRKEVKSVVEKYGSLLLYTNQYEGIEESSNIIYLGATPNQQMIPAVKWMMDKFGKRVYLIGSHYIYPHDANEIAKHQIESLGGQVVGKKNISFQNRNWSNLVENIKQLKPDFIINTINGNANIVFMNAFFNKASVVTPVISMSLVDGMTPSITKNAYVHMYSSWTYLSQLQNHHDLKFKRDYQEKYGSDKDINDPAMTAYSSMFLLSHAVTDAPNIEPSIIREKLLRESIASPAGVIYIGPHNGYAWRQTYIRQRDQTVQTVMRL